MHNKAYAESKKLTKTYSILARNLRLAEKTEKERIEKREIEKQIQQKNDDRSPSTWYCNETCDINVENIYNRFYTIIQVVLASTEDELINFINNVDTCDNRDLATVTKLGHPKVCYTMATTTAAGQYCYSLEAWHRTIHSYETLFLGCTK